MPADPYELTVEQLIALGDQDAPIYATAEAQAGVKRSLLKALRRLKELDDLTARYRAAPGDRSGATVADCMSFVANELNHIAPGGLDATMRRRYYQTILEKLTELQAWRGTLDAERFAEQERRAREQAEAIRRQKEQYERYSAEWKQRFTDSMNQQYEEVLKGTYGKRKGQAGQQQQSQGFSADDLKKAWERFKSSLDGPDFDYDAYQKEYYYQRQAKDKPQPDLRGKKWYEILGVPPTADRATIKSAWRQLAKRYHPDKVGGSNERMAAINAAKDVALAGASR